MRRADKLCLGVIICAALSVALVTAAPVDATTSAPTPAQIKAAITAATRSKLLWATLNSCNDDHNQVVGIRGEMPALPFPAHLIMVVTVDEWSATAHRYIPVNRSWKLGGEVFEGGGAVQNGIELRWPGQVTLTAKITFEWFRDGKLLGSTTRTTTGGHHDDQGTPRGYSVGTCSIP